MTSMQTCRFSDQVVNRRGSGFVDQLYGNLQDEDHQEKRRHFAGGAVYRLGLSSPLDRSSIVQREAKE